MNSYVISLIRTWVPIGVGAALTWVAATLHIVITSNSEASLVSLCVLILSAVYYALARFLETKIPALSFLLGTMTSPPHYTTKRVGARSREAARRAARLT